MKRRKMVEYKKPFGLSQSIAVTLPKWWARDAGYVRITVLDDNRLLIEKVEKAD
jgi:hypothetical protein